MLVKIEAVLICKAIICSVGIDPGKTIGIWEVVFAKHSRIEIKICVWNNKNTIRF